MELQTITKTVSVTDLEQAVDAVKDDLEQLKGIITGFSRVENQSRYARARAFRYLEKLMGKSEAKTMFMNEYDLSISEQWLRAYDVVSTKSDAIKEQWLQSPKFGVALTDFVGAISNRLEKASLPPISDDQFGEIIDAVEEKGMRIGDAKDYIEDNYFSSELGGSPAEMPDNIDFTPDQKSDKIVLVPFKFDENDVSVMGQWLGIDEWSNDPKSRGEQFYRAFQDMVLKVQSAGGLPKELKQYYQPLIDIDNIKELMLEDMEYLSNTYNFDYEEQSIAKKYKKA